jgi:hypothetical protein
MVFPACRKLLEWWSLGNPKLQAPNLRVSVVPPQADQVSGKKDKKTET